MKLTLPAPSNQIPMQKDYTRPMLRDAKPLPGYPEPYGLLAAILQDGTREWRDELPGELSADATIWQPHPGLHSIGAIILHIAIIEIGWCERFVLGLAKDMEERKLLLAEEFDVDEWTWPTPPCKPLSWYYELHDNIRARVLDGMKNWPEPDAVLQMNDDLRRTPRWVLGHVIQHEAYHGGQAVLLHRLRMLQESGVASTQNQVLSPKI